MKRSGKSEPLEDEEMPIGIHIPVTAIAVERYRSPLGALMKMDKPPGQVFRNNK